MLLLLLLDDDPPPDERPAVRTAAEQCPVSAVEVEPGLDDGLGP